MEDRGNPTFHRLLRQVVVAHLLHALHRQCLFQDGRTVLQDYTAFELQYLLLQECTLLAVATADIDECDILVAEILAHLSGEIDRVEPGWETRKLRFHEPMESTLLDRMGLHPRVKVHIRMLTCFKGIERLVRMAQHRVERPESWKAVVVATHC